MNDAKGKTGLDVIVRRAETKGHDVDRSTFARAFTGDHAKRPQDATLRAFADGLEIDVNELRRICAMPEGESGPYRGPDESARLNREQRKALDQLIKTIVAQREVEAASDKLGTVTVLPGSGKSQVVADDQSNTPKPKAARDHKAPSKAEAEQQMRDVTGSQDPEDYK